MPSAASGLAARHSKATDMHVLELEVESTPAGTRVSLRPQGRGGPVRWPEPVLREVHVATRRSLAAAVPHVDVVEAPLLVEERRIGLELGVLAGSDAVRNLAIPTHTVLAVLPRGPHAEALPWELLRTDPGAQADELDRRLIVVRSGGLGGAPAPEPRPSLEVALWCPDPDDPVCAEVAEALRGTLDALRIPVVAHDGPVPADRLRVVHVVAHGTRESGLLGVVGSRTQRGVEAMVASLRPVAGAMGVAAVVLDICGTGTAWCAVEDRLPAALLRAGCPAVRCPDRALGAEAAIAANPAFYAALAAQCSVVEATAAARRAVCGLGLGRTDARWYRLQLHVGCFTPESLGRPVVQPTVVQSRWPGATAELRGVLAQAAQSARGRSQAAVDSLDLARALAALDTPTPGVVRLRRVVSMLDEARLRRPFWQVLVPVEQVEHLAPRVERWARSLGGDATPEALAGRLVDDPRHVLALRYLTGTLSDNTDDTVDLEGVTPTPPDVAGRPVLEVLGGPEDGRAFRVGPGEVLGRRSDDPRVVHALFADTRGYDAGVSRRHLRIVAWSSSSAPGDREVGVLRVEGRVAARRLAVGSRIPERLPRHVDVAVSLGDVLILTDDTWLQVWVAPE